MRNIFKHNITKLQLYQNYCLAHKTTFSITFSCSGWRGKPFELPFDLNIWRNEKVEL